MQNRYAGDVGDYVKLALLRALSPGLKLGIAWYLYDDEGHNLDGKHVAYLNRPSEWRFLDPDLFDRLNEVANSTRSVAALEQSGVVNAAFAAEPLNMGDVRYSLRSAARQHWFSRVLESLNGCNLVFADPDNGLTDDSPARRSKATFGKQLPVDEALALASGRSAVIYHHNSRFRGGHDLEVDHWREQLGGNAIAVRANAYSCRTFFILNPTPELRERVQTFCARWRDHKVRLDA
jgi:hypothetical protein